MINIASSQKSSKDLKDHQQTDEESKFVLVNAQNIVQGRKASSTFDILEKARITMRSFLLSYDKYLSLIILLSISVYSLILSVTRDVSLVRHTKL